MGPQNDPIQRGLQVRVALHPDRSSGIPLRIQLDHLDHVTEKASGVVFREEVRVEDVRELPLLEVQVISTRSKGHETKLDKDGATGTRPELEHAEVGKGMQGG